MKTERAIFWVSLTITLVFLILAIVLYFCDFPISTLLQDIAIGIFSGALLSVLNLFIQLIMARINVIYDSKNEKKFAEELDISENVAVYVKLPGSFFISTPVGKYNPDWAIAFHEGAVQHIYFVAETKGNLDSMELRGIEKAKIECAKAHFAAISNESVLYQVVDNYSTLMQIVTNTLPPAQNAKG